MKQYEIESIGRKTILFKKNGVEVAKLDHLGWLGFDADILINGRVSYQLRRKGVFKRAILLLKDGVEMGSLIFRFGGKLDVTTAPGEVYVLKRKTFFSREFVLMDSRDAAIFTIRPRFQLSGFKHCYDIIAAPEIVEGSNILLLMLNIYGIAYIRKIAASQG